MSDNGDPMALTDELPPQDDELDRWLELRGFLRATLQSEEYFGGARERIETKLSRVSNRFEDRDYTDFCEFVDQFLRIPQNGILSNVTSPGSKDFLKLAHQITTDVFRELLLIVWNSLEVPTSGINAKLMVKNFVDFCKIRKSLGLKLMEEICQDTGLTAQKIIYEGLWWDWEDSKDKSKSSVHSAFKKARDHRDTRAVVRSKYLGILSYAGGVRDTNEHRGRLACTDVVTNTDEDGSYIAMFSLWILSLYALDELLDLVAEYLEPKSS